MDGRWRAEPTRRETRPQTVIGLSGDIDNERYRSNQNPTGGRPRGAVHEGYAGFPAVRILGADRRRIARLAGAIRSRQYFRRSGSARGAEELFQLADVSAAL